MRRTRRRAGLVLGALALSVMAAGALTGCGASLDREVMVQDMMIEVPSTWLESRGDENSETSGVVSFLDKDDSLDDDEEGNSIVISYEQPQASAATTEDAGEESSANAARTSASAEGGVAAAGQDAVPATAAEALAAKQAEITDEHGVSAWSIDDERAQVIDGAQVTVYEYSFVKEIEGVRHRYEYNVAYVHTLDTVYEISVIGTKVNIDSLVDTIAF